MSDPAPYASPVTPPVAPPMAEGSFEKGLGAAVGAALLGAVGWAIVTVVTDYRIGFVAVGIGFLVGMAIERFGGGDPRLPVVGAIVALAGCVLGDLLAEAHIIAKDVGISIWTVLQKPDSLWRVYTHVFRAFDFVFYAIAAYEGWRFAKRGVLRMRAAKAAAAAAAAAPGAPGTYPGHRPWRPDRRPALR